MPATERGMQLKVRGFHSAGGAQVCCLPVCRGALSPGVSSMNCMYFSPSDVLPLITRLLVSLPHCPVCCLRTGTVTTCFSCMVPELSEKWRIMFPKTANSLQSRKHYKEHATFRKLHVVPNTGQARPAHAPSRMPGEGIRTLSCG